MPVHGIDVWYRESLRRGRLESDARGRLDEETGVGNERLGPKVRVAVVVSSTSCARSGTTYLSSLRFVRFLQFMLQMREYYSVEKIEANGLERL